MADCFHSLTYTSAIVINTNNLFCNKKIQNKFDEIDVNIDLFWGLEFLLPNRLWIIGLSILFDYNNSFSKVIELGKPYWWEWLA